MAEKCDYLVVGADGTVGRALLLRLRSEECVVFGTSRRPGKTRGDDIVPLSLGEPGIEQFPKLPEAHAVFFCLAATSIAASEENPAATARINVDLSITLLEHLLEQGGFVVFPSSSMVFQGREPRVPEQAPVDPCCEYGRQKARVEEWLRENAPDRSAIVRITKVLSARMPLFVRWRDELARGHPIRPFSDLTMAPVWIDTAVDALLEIGKMQRGGVYHVSASEDVSYAEAARHVFANGNARNLVLPISVERADFPVVTRQKYTSLGMAATSRMIGMAAPTPYKALDQLTQSWTQVC